MKKKLLFCLMVGLSVVSHDVMATSYWDSFKSIVKSPYTAYKSYYGYKKVSDIKSRYKLSDADFKRILLFYPRFVSYSGGEIALIVNSDATLLNLIRENEQEDQKLIQAVGIKFDELSKRINGIQEEIEQKEAVLPKAQPIQAAAIVNFINIKRAELQDLCDQQEKLLARIEMIMVKAIAAKNVVLREIIKA